MACPEKFTTISLIRGDGTAGTVTVTLVGVAYDITGWTARLVAKANKSDTDANAVLNKRNNNEI